MDTDSSDDPDGLVDEIERVFKEDFIVTDEDDGTVSLRRVRELEWPDTLTYDCARLLAVLATVPDGAGASERGDADVRAALEGARAPTRRARAGETPAVPPSSTPKRPAAPAPPRKPRRNQLCPCGSGRKYRRCHGA